MAPKMQLLFVFVAMPLLSHLLIVPSFADQGLATFFSPPYVPSACDGDTDEGFMIAAASDDFWEGGKACGKIYTVRCTGPKHEKDENPCTTDNQIIVTIVDYCPDCQGAAIVLSEKAFGYIADPDAGIIRVEYNKGRV